MNPHILSLVLGMMRNLVFIAILSFCLFSCQETKTKAPQESVEESESNGADARLEFLEQQAPFVQAALINRPELLASLLDYRGKKELAEELRTELSSKGATLAQYEVEHIDHDHQYLSFKRKLPESEERYISRLWFYEKDRAVVLRSYERCSEEDCSSSLDCWLYKGDQFSESSLWKGIPDYPLILPILTKTRLQYDSELESKLHFEISRSGDSLIARVGDSRLKLSLNRDEGIFEFDGLYSEDEKKHLERLTSDLSSPERYLFANNWELWRSHWKNTGHPKFESLDALVRKKFPIPMEYSIPEFNPDSNYFVVNDENGELEVSYCKKGIEVSESKMLWIELTVVMDIPTYYSLSFYAQEGNSIKEIPRKEVIHVDFESELPQVMDEFGMPSREFRLRPDLEGFEFCTIDSCISLVFEAGLLRLK